MNGLNFRKGVSSDVEALYHLERSIFGEESYTREALQFLLADTAHSIVYIAENNTGIIGFGVSGIRPFLEAVYDNPGPVFNLQIPIKAHDMVGVMKSIAVVDDAEFRRKGIGSRLVLDRFTWLKNHNIHHVFAHAMPGSNFVSLAHKMNYTWIKAWKGKTYADGSEALLFYKWLA